MPEDKIFLLSLLMAEMGVHSVAYAFPSVRIITTAVDKRVNDLFRIIPGIGEAQVPSPAAWGTLGLPQQLLFSQGTSATATSAQTQPRMAATRKKWPRWADPPAP